MTVTDKPWSIVIIVCEPLACLLFSVSDGGVCVAVAMCAIGEGAQYYHSKGDT